jgi:uncharacterized protein (TIGR03000 family)
MYSVVLMMALSGGTESADFGHRKAKDCNGGCNGTVVVSCNGCTGTSCSGKYAACTGCTGSCTGCAGSCNGCNGEEKRGFLSRLFHHRAKDDCCGAPPPCSGCNGKKNGCHGPVACCGAVPVTCCGTVVVEPAKTMEPKVMPKEKIKTPPVKKDVSAPATVVVTLPADARLFVDGNATTSTSERRTFVTPNLETGWNYTYTIRAEVVRDGRTMVQTEQVNVRGGQTTNVPFSFSSQGVASR